VEEMKPKKKKDRTFFGFVFLLTALIAALILPVLFFAFRSKELHYPKLTNLMKAPEFSEESVVVEEVELEAFNDSYQVEEKSKQSVKVTKAKAGDMLVLNVDETYTLEVEQAYIIQKADTVDEFPTGENLVGVKIIFQSFDESSTEYHIVGSPYISYKGNYKSIIPGYYFDNYKSMFPDSSFISNWELIQGVKIQGDFAVFVKDGIKKINFFVECHDETTNDIVKIYKVPLTIEEGDSVR